MADRKCAESGEQASHVPEERASLRQAVDSGQNWEHESAVHPGEFRVPSQVILMVTYFSLAWLLVRLHR